MPVIWLIFKILQNINWLIVGLVWITYIDKQAAADLLIIVYVGIFKFLNAKNKLIAPPKTKIVL